MRWAKYKKNSKGDRDVPEGNECRPCLDGRKHNMGNISQSKLIQMMDASPALSQKFNELRDGHAKNIDANDGLPRGSKKYQKHEVVDSTMYSKKEDENYTDRFKDLKFNKLADFCSKKAPERTFKNDEQRREFVRSLGMETIWDHGEEGVAIDPGDGWTLRIGMRSAATKGSHNEYQSKTKQKEQHAAHVASLGQANISPKTEAEIREALAKLEQPSEEDSSSNSDSDSDSKSSSSSEVWGVQKQNARPGNRRAPKKKPAKPRTGQKQRREEARAQRSRSQRSRSPRSPVSPTDGASETRQSMDEGQTPRNLAGKNDAMLHAGLAHLKKADDEFSPEEMWNGKVKQRAVERFQSQSAVHSSKLASLCGDDAARELSIEIYEKSVSVESLARIFTNVRANPLNSISADYTDVDRGLLSNLNASLLGTVILHIGSQLNKMEPECLMGIIKLSVALPNSPHLCIGLMSSNSGDKKFLQVQLLGTWYEKVFKSKGLKHDDVASVFSRESCPNFPRLEDLSLTGKLESDEEILPNGLFPAVQVELGALELMFNLAGLSPLRKQVAYTSTLYYLALLIVDYVFQSASASASWHLRLGHLSAMLSFDNLSNLNNHLFLLSLFIIVCYPGLSLLSYCCY